MIIELFGPPGSGKTTFARALTSRLGERGHLAELRLSYRPTERLSVLNPGEAGVGRCPAERRQNVVIHRLSRPLGEMLTIALHPFSNSRDVKTAVHLIRLLPPTGIFASIKNGQYISRLSHSWHEKSRAMHVVLFDQGFVQAVCSLALLAGAASDAKVADALDYAPTSDLLIRLEAPLELLKARLEDRRRRQSPIEQLFEPDLTRSLASISMIDRLHALLLERGRSVLRASSLDHRSLGESVSMIEKEIIWRFQNRARRSSVMTTARAAASCYGGDRYE
jgi:adenylate kinase family enzyme